MALEIGKILKQPSIKKQFIKNPNKKTTKIILS